MCNLEMMLELLRSLNSCISIRQISRFSERKRRIKSVLASVTALRTHGIPFFYIGHQVILPRLESIRRYVKQSDMSVDIIKIEIIACYVISTTKSTDSKHLSTIQAKMISCVGTPPVLRVSSYPLKPGKCLFRIHFPRSLRIPSSMTLFA